MNNRDRTFKLLSMGLSEEVGNNYCPPKRKTTSKNYKGFSISWGKFRWFAQRKTNGKSEFVAIGKSLYDVPEKIDSYLIAKELEKFNNSETIKKWKEEIEKIDRYEDSLIFVLMQQKIIFQVASKIYFMRKFSSKAWNYERELKKLKKQLTKWEWILVGNLLGLGNTFDEIFVALTGEKENAD